MLLLTLFHFSNAETIKINAIICNETPVPVVFVMELRLELLAPVVVFCFKSCSNVCEEEEES